MLITNNIVITPELLKTIATIDEFKGYWRGSPALDPTIATSLQMEALEEDIKSTLALSGHHLRDDEILNLQQENSGESLARQAIRLGAGVRDVLAEVSKWPPEKLLSERRIKELHRLLVARLEHDTSHAGAYWANSYRHGIYDDMSQESSSENKADSLAEKELRMASLVNWLEQQTAGHQMHPILVAALLWAAFLGTRPFKIGNDVLNVALTTTILTRAGYTFIKFDSLVSLLHADCDKYLAALKSATSTAWTTAPIWHTWLQFFAKAMESLTRRLPAKVDNAQRALGNQPKVAQQILQLLKERGRANISDVVRLTGQNRNTVKHHLSALKTSGRVSQVGAGRGASYQLPKTMKSKGSR